MREINIMATILTDLPARLKAAHASGKTLMSAWLGIPDPWISAIMASEDFDLITYDMQHSALSYDTVVRGIPLVQAAGKPAVVRIPVGDFTTGSRLLDAGASGIIAPMVNTVADAKLFAEYCKYPPMGGRSWGAYAALAQSGLEMNAYFKAANGFALAIAMIETREALAIMDNILAEPGIDGVLIGPSDLSIALSDGKHVDPLHADVNAAVMEVRRRSKAAGKSLWIYAHTPERAAEFAKMGADVVCLMGDTPMLKLGAQAALKAVRA
jgi:4-hydroxy-2-oxoheptanedioate aldolase